MKPSHVKKFPRQAAFAAKNGYYGENMIQSIKKAFDILNILVFEDIEGKGVGLNELSARLNQNNTTMHNILTTMALCGYVSKIEKGLYAAGSKCREIKDTNNILPGSASYNQINDIITELNQQLNENVTFAIFINGARVPLIKIESDKAIMINMKNVESKNTYATATGRVLAAFTEDTVQDA